MAQERQEKFRDNSIPLTDNGKKIGRPRVNGIEKRNKKIEMLLTTTEKELVTKIHKVSGTEDTRSQWLLNVVLEEGNRLVAKVDYLAE